MVPLFWDSNLGRMLFAGLTSDKSRNRKLTPSFGRVADPARRFLLLRRAGLFQNRLLARGRRGNRHGGLGRWRPHGGGSTWVPLPGPSFYDNFPPLVPAPVFFRRLVCFS